MRNFSITAVPPEVSSRSTVALFMFVLSVSQWPTRAFSFSNASAPPPGRACVITGRIAALSTNAQTIFNKPFIDRSPLMNFPTHKKTDHSKLDLQRAAAAGSLFLPKRCVANPTIAPRSMPGTMMSQNKAIPARRTTSRLSTAAIPIPARIPSTIECTRCETYPVVIPATNPFSSENVITLPIFDTSDGSKNPLNPSISPSTPPTTRPSMGFVSFIAPSCGSALRSTAASFRILVGPHFRLFLACRRRCCGSCAVPLRGVSHDHSNDAAGQNDFEIIAVLHVGDQKRQHESYGEAEQDPERHRIYLSSENAGRDSRNQALHRRANNDANHLRAYGRGKPRRSSIDCAQDCAEQKSQQHFVHHSPPSRFVCLVFLTTDLRIPLGLSMHEKQNQDAHQQVSCNQQDEEAVAPVKASGLLKNAFAVGGNRQAVQIARDIERQLRNVRVACSGRSGRGFRANGRQ